MSPPGMLRYPSQFYRQFARCKTWAHRKWLVRRWREMAEPARGTPWVW